MGLLCIILHNIGCGIFAQYIAHALAQGESPCRRTGARTRGRQSQAPARWPRPEPAGAGRCGGREPHHRRPEAGDANISRPSSASSPRRWAPTSPPWSAGRPRARSGARRADRRGQLAGSRRCCTARRPPRIRWNYGPGPWRPASATGRGRPGRLRRDALRDRGRADAGAGRTGAGHTWGRPRLSPARCPMPTPTGRRACCASFATGDLGRASRATGAGGSVPAGGPPFHGRRSEGCRSRGR